MDNEFVDIKGWEGLYKVNILRQVKSLQKTVKRWGNYRQPRKEKLLKPMKIEGSYCAVELQNEGIRKKIYIHRLIAIRESHQ